MNAPVLAFEARRHTATRERDRIVVRVRRLQRVSWEGLTELDAWLDAAIAKCEDRAARSRA
jgi:hypothetical protein